MVNKAFIEDLARRLADTVSPGAAALGPDLDRNFKAVLDSAFERLDLVTREEFDVQRRVLERTREKLTALERQLAELEQSGTRGESDDPAAP